MAPAEWKTLKDLYAQWQNAKSGLINMGAFCNVELGEPYAEEGEKKLVAEEIKAKMTSLNYTIKTPPKNIKLVTGAIDCHPRLQWFEVIGWSSELESYSLYREAIPIPIKEVDNLQIALRELFSRLYASRKLSLVCIDARYESESVYELCARFPAHFDVVNGGSGGLTPVMGVYTSNPTKLISGKPGEKRRKAKLTGKHWSVNVDYAKYHVHQTLCFPYTNKLNRKMYAPNDYPLSYYEEISSQHPVAKINKSGRKVMHFANPNDAADEAMDLRVYNMAAVHILDYPQRDYSHLLKETLQSDQMKERAKERAELIKKRLET